MTLPLAGVRVLELSIWVQGPLAGTLLAALGAEVIKLEKPGQGDFSRGAQTLWGARLLREDGRAIMWEYANRQKKSVALDLGAPAGQDLFGRLIDQADVFLTNLHPSALREFQADRTSVLKRNPKIIYSQATVAGRLGPEAEVPGQDTTGMARSGFMYNLPGPNGEPVYQVGGLSDVLSGTMLAFGVVTALLGRERQGTTPTVDASQLSAMLWLQSLSLASLANTGQAFEPVDRRAVGNPLMNLYRCADDRWIALGLYLSDRFWSSFCESIERPDLAADPRYGSEVQRAEHCRTLITSLDEVLATRPREEWERRFKQRDFWFAPVNRLADVLTDPQVIANGYLTQVDNGLTMAGLPFQFEDGGQDPQPGAPELGQHTEQALLDLAGCSWDELASLRQRGVI